MMKNFILPYVWLLLFTLYHPLPSDAQNSESVEILTYRMFEQQKWDSLILAGEAAISAGTDYFYLRLRVGRAALELQQYARAANHLEFAHNFNEADFDAAHLLYLAYRYGGRPVAAGFLCARLSKKTAHTICHKRYVPEIGAEAGFLTSNQNKQYHTADFDQKLLYSEDHTFSSANYGLFTINQPLGYRLGLTAATTFWQFNKQRDVTIAGRDTLFSGYTIKQTAFFLAPAIILSKHFALEPALHRVTVSYTNPLVSYDSINAKYVIPADEIKYHDFVTGVQLTYSQACFDLYAGAWVSRYADHKLTQTGVGITLRPFGNLNVYSVSALNLAGRKDDMQLLFFQKAGFRLTKRLWLELFASVGGHTGTSAFNARVFYNQIDKVKFFAGGKFIVPLNSHVMFNLSYQWMEIEGNGLKIMPSLQKSVSIYKYQNQIINGGLTWKIKG